MQENGAWISNNYIRRIKNPLYNVTDDKKFVGYAGNYDFGGQAKNFEKLKESLDPFNIYPTTIHAGTSAAGTAFIVETNSPVVWYKRICNTYSSNNFLYLVLIKLSLRNG